VNAIQVNAIRAMIEQGDSDADIAEALTQSEIDRAEWLATDDSDEAMDARNGISQDDRYDFRGEALLPRINEAGEPNWW